MRKSVEKPAAFILKSAWWTVVGKAMSPRNGVASQSNRAHFQTEYCSVIPLLELVGSNPYNRHPIVDNHMADSLHHPARTGIIGASTSTSASRSRRVPIWHTSPVSSGIFAVTGDVKKTGWYMHHAG